MAGYKNSITDIDGKVGIGIPDPAVAFEVDGFVRFNGGIQLDGTNRTIYAINNTDILFGTNNAERLRIDSGGTVKISGTTNEYSMDILKSSEPKLRLFQNDGSLNPRMTISCDNTGTLFDHTFSSSANAVRFAFSGSEKMRIDSSGRVGIGTTNPSAKMTIEDGDFARLDLNLANATGTTIADVRGLVEGTEKWRIGKTSSASDDFTINITGSERMRIDSSGNVGIGVVPAQTLNVVNTSNYQLRLGTPNSAAAYWEMGRDNVSTGDFLISNGTERMRITSSGLLYAYNLGAGGATTDINYNTSTGEIYYVTSSARYKENIEELQDSALDKINNLKVKTFDYIDSEEFKGQVGLIAEEVNEHLPFLVNKREIEGYEEPQPDSVKYSMLSVYLLKAIQELNDKVVSLEERLSQYEAK
jgi:hypothetical protein